MNNKIPKLIHYCWFGGGKKDSLILGCIESWRKKLPDYQIIEWNENNFDVNINSFVKEAYENKKWAFVSDYVRIWALKTYGGIYLDSDMELIKGLNEFLKDDVFFGLEIKGQVSTAIIGAKANNNLMKEILEYYENINFIDDNNRLNILPNTKVISKILKKYGLKENNIHQKLMNNVKIYPIEYFSPKNQLTNKVTITNNTYSIHHFSGSWLSIKQRLKIFLKRIFVNIKNTMRTKNEYK